MVRHGWQTALAAAVWSLVLAYAGVPVVPAVLIPVDVVLVILAALGWRSPQLQT